MKRGIIVFIAALLCFLACGDEEYEYGLGEFVVGGHEAAWGNNGLIAFSNSSDICTCDEYGRNVKNITENGRYDYVAYPAWSPDCRYIVYSQYRGENKKLGLYIISAEGGEPRLLVEEGERPAWSPDGKWIAYVASGGEINNNLWVIPAEGGEAKRLTEGHYVWGPTWGVNGKWVIFSGYDKDNGRDLWAVDTEKGEVKKLTYKGISCISGRPSMRVDGEWVAFSYYPKYGPSDIWAFNVKTKDFARVTRVWEESCGSGAWEPSWAPDGRRLVYTCVNGLYKVRVDF